MSSPEGESWPFPERKQADESTHIRQASTSIRTAKINCKIPAHGSSLNVRRQCEYRNIDATCGDRQLRPKVLTPGQSLEPEIRQTVLPTHSRWRRRRFMNSRTSLLAQNCASVFM